MLVKCSPCISGRMDNLPRQSRGQVTTQAQDRYIRLRHLCKRTVPATRTAAATIGMHNLHISAQTVINRLLERGIRAKRPYVPILTQRHRNVRLQWCRAHRTWLARQWHQVLFTNESRFSLENYDGRTRVYRRNGE